MYPRSLYYRPQKGAILPFLILVILGLTLVFAFQLFQYVRERSVSRTENKAAVTIMKGRAETKIWGASDFIPARTGSILREGDSIRVLPDSRVSLAFLNGSFLRADGNTLFVMESLRSRDAKDDVKVLMEYGDIWLKGGDGGVGGDFSVDTEDFSVKSSSTVFSVSKQDDFRVRVINGNVDVKVKETLENGRINIIETAPVAVGQEFIASDKVLGEFMERKSPSAIFAFSDAFRDSEWYAWNIEEDATAFKTTLTVEEAVNEEKDVTLVEIVAQESVSESASDVSAFSAPVIITPSSENRRSAESRLIVSGTASAATQKVIVKSFTAGKEDAYTLQKYAPGSAEWNYIVDEAYGNWVSGKNRFEIIAVSKDGREAKTELTLTYDKVVPAADLAAPEVLSFGGSRSIETAEDSIRVEGSIGKGIVKVYVDDFALTKYVSGSDRWVYYAKTEYGNLKEGVNEYEVYGLDSEGRKTEVTKFTIVKNTASSPEQSTDRGNFSPLE